MRPLTENPFIRKEASSRDLVSRLLGAADDKPAPLAAAMPPEPAGPRPEAQQPPLAPTTEQVHVPGPAFDFPEGWWQRFLETQKRMVREFFGGGAGL